MSSNHKTIIAKKHLGQNFLIDNNIINNIVKLVPEIPTKNILEIGSGTGNLSQAIMKKKPLNLLLVEKDTELSGILSNLIQNHYPQTKLITQDALHLNFPSLLAANNLDKITIIANLPYNIATQLLINFLYNIRYIEQMTLMFQKEVVERITATPNSKKFGRLAIISQALCHHKKNFDVSSQCFSPQPKITSSVITLTPKLEKKSTDISEIKNLERTSLILFNNRRKQLQNILTVNKVDIKFLDDLDINPQLRPEQLSIQQILLISKHLKSLSTSPIN